MSKKYFKFIFYMLILLILNINVVLAADFDVCQKASVIRTLKILGIILIIVKIVIPLILIITSVTDFAKSVLAGNADDIKKNTSALFRRLLAAAIIMVLPSFLNFMFNNLVNRDEDGSFQICTNCLLDPDNCVIPE